MDTREPDLFAEFYATEEMIKKGEEALETVKQQIEERKAYILKYGSAAYWGEW